MEVKELLLRYKLSLCFLVETHVLFSKLEKFLKQQGYSTLAWKRLKGIRVVFRH